MAENLRVSRYTNGEVIPNVTTYSSWYALSTGAWVNYQHDATLGSTYGKLYNWFAVNDLRGICPSGWRMPSPADWNALVAALGGTAVAGGAVKSTNSSHWNSPNLGASNSSGFNALGAGYANRDPANQPFFDLRIKSYWWTNQEESSSAGRSFVVSSEYQQLLTEANSKNFGFSVRCVR